MKRSTSVPRNSVKQEGPAALALAVALCLLFGPGCSSDSGAPGPSPGPADTCPPPGTAPDPAAEISMIFDLSGAPIAGGASFFDLPFPLDLRLDAAGKTDLSNFPNPDANDTVRQILDSAHRHMEGWPTTTQIYLRLTGPLNPESLPSDPAAYMDPAAVVQLLDVDPASPERGRRFPLEVEFNTGPESFRPANLLQVLPVQGFELRQDNAYALIVTRDIGTADGRLLVAEPNLCEALAGRMPAGHLNLEAMETYAPLAAQLALEGRDPGTVAAATVFTTGRPTDRMFHVVERVAAWPAPRPREPLVKTADYADYCVYASSWEVPGLQAGRVPFLAEAAGGVIEFDAAGEPVPQYTRSSPFVVTVPRTAMPAGGYPLLFYIHGTGGLSTQVYDRGRMDAQGRREPGRGPSEIAAERGWGSSCMGGHMSNEHLGPLLSLGGYIPYNFFNLQAMRDSFIQMTAEQVLFRRLLTELAFEVSDCAGADTSVGPGGLARFDPEMQVVMGHSLGGYLSGLAAATDPRAWQGAILSGAGGSWTEFALGPQNPPLTPLLEAVLGMQPRGERLDRWHPIIQAATLSIAGANNIHFLPFLYRDPIPGRSPPHMLVIQGEEDLQVTVGLQRALVAALGVDMVGPDVTEIPPGIPVGPEGQIIQRIELAGGRLLEPPVSGNRMVEGQGLRTVAVVRYPEDGILEGHSVLFQREEPKHQFGCFLEDLSRGRVPTIVEGVVQGGACAP